MKINIEKSHLWNPCGPPLPPISLLSVRSYWNFHTVKSKKKHFWNPTVLESLKDFLRNVQNIFVHFEHPPPPIEKNIFWPPPPLPPFWGGSSDASPLEISDVMPPYPKRRFEQKSENL